MEIVLDFNGQENLVEEINNQAASFGLNNEKIAGKQVIYKYSGNADGVYDLGKYIGGKGYDIVIASR